MRTGQYKTINAVPVFEGEITSYNKFTGEYTFGEKKSEKIIGYMAYFKLLNGFEKYYYMTYAEIEKHANRYSRSYQQKTGVWMDDFNAMALKTVLRLLLSKFGVLSTEMQRALQTDQGVIKSEKDIDYEDNPENEKTETVTLTPETTPETETEKTETKNNNENSVYGKVEKIWKTKNGDGVEYLRVKVNGENYFTRDMLFLEMIKQAQVENTPLLFKLEQEGRKKFITDIQK